MKFQGTDCPEDHRHQRNNWRSYVSRLLRSVLMEHLTPGPPRARSRAPTVFCYICGRQYGSKSIQIHEPQCLEKWRIANAKLPKSQRRQEPVRPEVIKVGGKIDFEAMNAAAYEASLAQRMRCEHCGRSFADDRLAVHQRSCTRDNPARPVGELRTRRDVPLATAAGAAQRRREQKANGGAVNVYGDRRC